MSEIETALSSTIRNCRNERQQRLTTCMHGFCLAQLFCAIGSAGLIYYDRWHTHYSCSQFGMNHILLLAVATRTHATLGPYSICSTTSFRTQAFYPLKASNGRSSFFFFFSHRIEVNNDDKLLLLEACKWTNLKSFLNEKPWRKSVHLNHLMLRRVVTGAQGKRLVALMWIQQWKRVPQTMPRILTSQSCTNCSAELCHEFWHDRARETILVYRAKVCALQRRQCWQLHGFWRCQHRNTSDSRK